MLYLKTKNMKRYLVLGLLIIFSSCSPDYPDRQQDIFKEVNLNYVVDGCEIYSYEFESYGEIEVRNFYDYLKITVTSYNYPLSQLNLHFSDNVNGFPTVGKKKRLIPSKLKYQNKFDSDIYEISLQYSFDELSIEGFSDEILIAAYAEFGSGKNKKSLWAGEEGMADWNWKYFKYAVSPFENYAGNDKIIEMTRSEVAALPSYDEVRKVFANMLDAGVNKYDGVYSPSIYEIISYYNSLDEEAKLDDFTVTYTLGKGECSGSAELTVRVVADE